MPEEYDAELTDAERVNIWETRRDVLFEKDFELLDYSYGLVPPRKFNLRVTSMHIEITPDGYSANESTPERPFAPIFIHSQDGVPCIGYQNDVNSPDCVVVEFRHAHESFADGSSEGQSLWHEMTLHSVGFGQDDDEKTHVQIRRTDAGFTVSASGRTSDEEKVMSAAMRSVEFGYWNCRPTMIVKDPDGTVHRIIDLSYEA